MSLKVNTIEARTAVQVTVDDDLHVAESLTVGETFEVTGASALSSVTLTTDLAIADGGTGASTAAAARTNLDVPSTSEAILDTIMDAKGDILTATAADTPARLAVGTDTYALVADSATSTGLNWANVMPTGVVLPYAGSTEPTGWLFCYGQAISRTTYATLFTAISTTFGVGDGSTTFNLPDLRGRVVAGKDDMGGVSANRLTDQSGGLDGDVLGDSGGAETHTLTSTEIAAHTHAAGSFAASSDGDHTHRMRQGQADGVGDANASYASTSGGGSGGDALEAVASGGSSTLSALNTNSGGSHTHSISGTSGSAGSDGAHNNVQPTFILNYIIKI